MVIEFIPGEESTAGFRVHLGRVSDRVKFQYSGIKLPRRVNPFICENSAAAGHFVVTSVPAGILDGVHTRALDHFCNRSRGLVAVAIVACR
jgi:hypothetical protein